MTEPNFFIVGAPKCGTTAMYNLLGQHPEVFLPKEKELHYFAQDLYPQGYISDNDYYSLFDDASGERIIGEASVWYLYSQQAPLLISKSHPNAKILIMLRNPIDMLYSLYVQHRYDNIERLDTFSKAIDVEDERKRGKILPSTVYHPSMLFYSEIGRYSEMIQRYIRQFGRDNIHIIIHDDFCREPYKIYGELLEFLGVEPDFKPVLTMENERRQAKVMFIQKMINQPAPVKALLRSIIPFKLRRSLLSVINQLNSSRVDRTRPDEATEERLVHLFENEVDVLGRILDRDLSGWLEQKSQ